MAFGSGENPELSVTTHLDAVEYPVWREQLAKAAADNGAPVDIINLFKALPRAQYENKEQVQRDLSEASRRFAMVHAERTDHETPRDRRNIGRDMVENATNGRTRHP